MKEILSRLRGNIDPLLAAGKQVIVAIDGNCTAGKTTLAGLLKGEYDCNVFHMDDFFLRPEQRTAERYAQPGGNVDYERFRAEVLDPLQQGEAFSYRPFSCATFTLTEPVQIESKQLNIVEGTYSQHPYFGDIYDYKVFLTVESAVQRQRILERPAFLHQRFFEEWIPMEKQYFDHFQIPARCDLILNMDNSKLE